MPASIIADELNAKVGRSRGRGLGVFATKDFRKGDLVERSVYILLPRSQSDHIMETKLANYVFRPPRGFDQNACLMMLGFGSVYNHAQKPNAELLVGGNRVFEICATKRIRAGEEITISYGCEPWFEVR